MAGLDQRPTANLNASYRHCHTVTRRAAANFYPAFLVLSRCRRRSMEALYAFLRATDDLADEPGDAAAKAVALSAWRNDLRRALDGEMSHPVHPALIDAVRRHDIPGELLFTVIDGVESDLRPVRFDTFDELYGYCYCVASAVGLSCVRIWGYRGEEALRHAEAAGVAFQMTNILRDVAEDRQAGRVYLPQDEIARFGCPAAGWRAECPAFQSLMAFQADRTRGYYQSGDALRNHLSSEGRAVFGALAGTYRGLLEEIAARRFDVFRGRVRLPKSRKAKLLLNAFRVRWGWA